MARKNKNKDIKKSEMPKAPEKRDVRLDPDTLDSVQLETHRLKTGKRHKSDPLNSINIGPDTEEQIDFRERLSIFRGKPITPIKKAAKGGAISKQMEMFAEGGLEQEGGSVDPVSGNSVPIGSTKEEVRDDIPAQLSEGEFVMPADVVRFHGLDKMMQLRDEAKMGLQRMDAMGQMGNSEEATLPDNTPFDINDLDMSDEEEPMGDTVQMAQGGVVKAAVGTFINPSTGIGGYQQSQFGNYTPPTVPNVPSQLPTTSYIAPTQQATPFAADQTNLPEFKDFIPAPEGKYDEIIEYVNAEGMKLSIPFVNGKPIYPIPTGYKKVDKGIVAPDPITQVPTAKVSQSVQNTEDGGDNKSPEEMQADRERAAQVSARTARAKELGYTPQNPITGILGAFTPLGMLGIGRTPGTIDPSGNVIGQDKRSYDPMTGNVVSTGSLFGDITNAITGKDISNTTPVTDPETGKTSMVEIGKGARDFGVTPMTAGGMKQYTINDMRGFINDVQKDLNVAKAEVEKANPLGKVDDLSTGRRDTAQFGLGMVDDLSTGRTDEKEADKGRTDSRDPTQEIGYDYSDDVAVDNKGNSSDVGPNAQGFDAYGSGVADRQGTASGVDKSGAISYSPDHDWGQPTQTSVDTGKGYSTSSTGAATTTSADERGKGLGSISTDGGPGETCFTKGTKVKLYKGGTIAIEKLKKGDVILGIYGEPNEVLGMDIHKVANDNRPELVQIEGYKKPFITANHPFYKFTPVKNSIYGKNQNFGTGVLMSFNNKQNDQYHPWLGEVEDAKEYFKYKKVLAKEDEMLYNLYLDGDHTHYANGLPVHNIVRNGHISFALFYKNYITAKQYEGDIEYVKGFKNKYVRLGYSKIAYPLAYEIMNDTWLGKITAKIATPFVKAFANAQQKQKASNLVKIFGYTFVYPTFYLRGLIGR